MPRSSLDRGAGYRRGTVMGLTVAEAFMLIAFVLLMLLGVWMATARERITALEERAVEAEQFAEAFTEEQKAAALAGRDHLELLGQDLVKMDAFRDLIAKGASSSDAVRALELLPVLDTGLPAEELLDRARLLDEDLLKDLAQAAVDLPPDARATLTNLARLEDFPAVAQLLEDGGLDRLRRDLEELEAFRALLADGAAPGNAQDIAAQLAAYRATGLPPEDVTRLTDTLDEVAAARLQATRNRAQIAAAVARQAGPVVAEVGGEVRPDGSIVFRDQLLFDAGSARITPAFDTALTRLCRPWIEVLYAERDGLSAVRIEGHASSEWVGQVPNAAFERNLDLSQARAASVFKRCLDLAGGDDVADWARTRMSAVGFSSSRPILADGVEDRAASRRVVFAIDTTTPDDALQRAFDAIGN